MFVASDESSMSEHTYDSLKSAPTAVVVRSERRRRFSNAQKQQILKESLEPGVTVTAVAKRHGVNTGQIYTWRRQALAGAIGGFIPVTVDHEAEDAAGSPPCRNPLLPMAESGSRSSYRMGFVFASAPTSMVQLCAASSLLWRGDDHAAVRGTHLSCLRRYR